VAPDGQSVTLNLRRGVKFHSGKDLTADDVVKNFAKAADKERGSNMLPAVANVADVTAPDAQTVVIKLKKVSPEITDLLQAMAIIEPAAMDSLKNKGSGTGPFKFVEWVPGDRTVLERNQAYWGQGTPWADRVVFKVFQDSDAMVAALQSGICDLVVSLPPKDVSRLSREFNLVRGHPGALTYELRVNGAKPPFDKKEARQALLYAVDRKSVVDNVLFGVSQPTVLPYSRASAAQDLSMLDKYAFNLNRAKELLSESRSLLETSLELGLSGTGRLHDLFLSLDAMTPGEFKRAGEGLGIRWGIHATPFGEALFALTERGLCGLSFLEMLFDLLLR
jgi:peptide/nickel transport system substrate-binding protein